MQSTPGAHRSTDDRSLPMQTTLNPAAALLFAATVVVVAGCAVPPPAAPLPAPTPVEPAKPQEQPPPPPPPPAPAPPPVTPATQQQSQRIAMTAIDLLQNGNEEQAKAELQRALVADPNNRLAQSLMRQIVADPVQLLGRESFEYRVRPNDSLSQIAKRFLNDIYSFYILARYNDIKVPRELAGGQVLRIPGKAPPPGSAPAAPPTTAATPAAAPERPAAAPAPAAAAAPAPPAPPPEPTAGERALRAGDAAAKSNDLNRALAEYRRADGLGQPGAAAKAEQTLKQLVARNAAMARAAFAKQDLDGAISAWDRVLILEPANENAKLERQRALSLKKRLEDIGPKK